MKVNNNYTAAVVRTLAGRLHSGAKAGTRCSCGPCRHEILVTARRIGVAPNRLIGLLPPEQQPKVVKERQRTVLSSPVRVAARFSGRGVNDPEVASLLRGWGL